MNPNAQQGQTVPASQLLQNPLIAAAIQRRQGNPQQGKPAQAQGQPPQTQAPQAMPTPQKPPNPTDDEKKIIINALSGHLKHIDKVEEATKIPPKPQLSPMMGGK
ncbi:MAG TPA: hypothetical protein VF941_14285 [Clostridia bacterium]